MRSKRALPCAAGLFLVALLSAQPSRVLAAEVVLASGESLEVEGITRVDGAVWLHLPGGGRLALPEGQIRTLPVVDAPSTPAPPAGAVRGPEAVAPAAVERPGRAEVRAGDAGLAGDVRRIAAGHGLDPELLLAVIQAESAGNPRAVSPKGAMGLMQLMPATARARGVSDPFDPVQNVEAGAAELADWLARYQGELALALSAYNAGGVAVDRHDGIPPYGETLRYVRRVLDEYYAALDARSSATPAR